MVTLYKPINSGEYDALKYEILDINRVVENPNQPRQFFDENAIYELSKSIKEYGIIQPLSVRKINNFEYELVAGERRLRAAKLLGMTSIPVVIVNIDDEASAVVSLIENIQRENLNFLEEAEAFQKLIAKYGFTQEQLSEKVGKSQSAIANKLRILKLGQTIKKVINDNNLTERHARALLKIDNESRQLEVLKKICDEKLNVKESEDLIDRVVGKKTDKKPFAVSGVKRFKATEGVHFLRRVKDFRIFENTIKQAIDFMNKSGINASYKIVEKDMSVEFIIKVPTIH